MDPMKKDDTLPLKPVARKDAMVTGDKYRFTVLTDRLIRMEYQAEGRFLDAPTQTVICREFPAVPFRVIDKEVSLEIVTEKLHLYYDKKPFSREGLTIHLREGFHAHGSTWSFGDTIADLRGTARTLDEADGPIELEAGLMSRQGFTVLDDSRSALIGPDQWPAARTTEATDLYFFGYGHDYLGCLRDFYRLSGPTPLLPRFALGNWWSRFYRYSEQSYLALMDKFREKGIPLSTAVIDMDWHLTDIPARYGSGWTGYTWNPALFPDPRRFMDKLHGMGLHVTLNVHPADGVRGHEEAYLPMAKELGVDWEHEDKIPFDASSRKFLEAYFKYLHHPQEERGVDFWWLDWQQGTRGAAKGIDTLWLLNHLHFLDSGRDGKIPLTFSRYAGLGSHRYPIGFSGDTYSTWESLNFQPYFTANASNAGFTWWSHDIGGHMGGRRDDELAVRWLQLGVFSPIMRLHSTCNEFYGKEPWNYQLQAERIMTRFLRLRHRLIPYLHSMNYRTHLEGEPLVQPMYYRHDTEEAYTVPNQYYFGSEMMVCPITRPVDRNTLLAPFEAWLPEGEWFDFFTGQRFRGGRKLTLYRDLETIPVLVKAGGIIPMAKDDLDCHTRNPAVLEVHVFPGGEGSFDLYEDNGGAPVVTRFRFADGVLSIGQDADPDGVIPGDRGYALRFRGMADPGSVRVEGAEADWCYDGESRELRVTLRRCGGRVRVALERADSACADMKRALYDMLRRAQIAYDVKTAVFDAVCRTADKTRLLGRLCQMDLDPALFGAVLEQILADS